MNVLSIWVLLFATASVASGQTTPQHVSESMRALNFLVGKWEGKVRYEPGANQLQELFWTAHVYYNVAGNILLIDEKGSEKENSKNSTLDILVVVYWDPALKEYSSRLYWYSKDGAGSVEGRVFVKDNNFVLHTKSKDQLNRFTLQLNEKGQWHEIGEISKDSGQSWKRRFEMTLNRQDVR